MAMIDRFLRTTEHGKVLFYLNGHILNPTKGMALVLDDRTIAERFRAKQIWWSGILGAAIAVGVNLPSRGFSVEKVIILVTIIGGVTYVLKTMRDKFYREHPKYDPLIHGEIDQGQNP